MLLEGQSPAVTPKKGEEKNLQLIQFLFLTGSPSLADNEFEGVIMKNVIQLEVRGAKDCLTLLESALKRSGIGTDETGTDYEESTLLIQFEMTKVCKVIGQFVKGYSQNVFLQLAKNTYN